MAPSKIVITVRDRELADYLMNALTERFADINSEYPKEFSVEAFTFLPISPVYNIEMRAIGETSHHKDMLVFVAGYAEALKDAYRPREA